MRTPFVGEWEPDAAAAALACMLGPASLLLLLLALVATPVRVCSWFIVLMMWFWE